MEENSSSENKTGRSFYEALKSREFLTSKWTPKGALDGVNMYDAGMFEKSIYPLQDKILSLINPLQTGFYLTGSTALARFHYKHRHTDTLDFFVSKDKQFSDYLLLILTKFKESSIQFTKMIDDRNFVRILVEDLILADFVNDISYYYGALEFRHKEIFSKIDNPMNILVNKIIMISGRESIADISDIWIIAQKEKVDWAEIFKAVNRKATGIYPAPIAGKLKNIDMNLLQTVAWTQEIDRDNFEKGLAAIIKEISTVNI